ncbi:MAG TPA: hypothetical protein VF505_10045 [Thermoanaerobaculia bacterium]
MSNKHTTVEENRIAEEILNVLPAGSVARICSDDHDSIRFTVSSMFLKLNTVAFDRESLLRLHSDPARAIKIEYLQRDLLRSAVRRAEFRYPRINRLFRKTSRVSRLRAATQAIANLAR